MTRKAFTLVELLIVMMIMAVLASIVLFALASVQESARADKTIATINKLNAIVMAKYESYRTRRVPITVPAGSTPAQSALLRLNAIREIIRAEMPDGFVDIDDPNHAAPKYLSQWPSVRAAYRTALQRAKAAPGFSTAKHDQTACCLYLFVTKGSGDPDVMEQFSPSELGAAPDGMPCFIDGWGHPIRFLRWAPAYRSPLQTAATGEHDPFDPLNVEPSTNQPTYPLFPLVYSAGPDGKYDIGEQPTGGADYWSANDSPFDKNLRNNIGVPTDLDGDGSIDDVDNLTNHE